MCNKFYIWIIKIIICKMFINYECITISKNNIFEKHYVLGIEMLLFRCDQF